MTRQQRARQLRHLADQAADGLLCLGSPLPDVARILAAIREDLLVVPLEGRIALACDLFASAAMSLAEALDPT